MSRLNNFYAQNSIHLVDVGTSIERRLPKQFSGDVRVIVESTIHHKLWHVVFPASRVDKLEGCVSPCKVEGIVDGY